MRTIHLPTSRMFSARESFRAIVTASSVTGVILEFEILGGFRSGQPSITFRIRVDGWSEVHQARRWTEHLAIIPDRRTVIAPPISASRGAELYITRSLVIEAEEESDYFFLGPVYSHIGSRNNTIIAVPSVRG